MKAAIMQTAKPASTAACVPTASKLLLLSSSSSKLCKTRLQPARTRCNKRSGSSLPFKSVALFLIKPSELIRMCCEQHLTAIQRAKFKE